MEINIMATLLEKYSQRLAVSDNTFAKSHNGAKMDSTRKLMVAACLENTNKFLSESFNNSVGTQRADMGEFRKFALNLVTVALPTLIAPELVMVYPMTSFSGYVNYLSYTAGSNKGSVHQGDIFNNVFGMPQTNNADAKYTASAVVEAVTSFVSGTTKVAWTPVVAGTIRALDANGVEVSDNETTAWTAAADGTITAGAYVSGKSASDVAKLAYQYDNVVIPQNDLPILNAEIKGIALQAKARRIAVFYSQMAAFQAKTDYGFNMEDEMAKQAVGQLAYEVDTEVVTTLDETAGAADAALTWSKTLPVGVSKMEHYEGFSEIIEIARAIIYNRTKRFAPNYMIIAADVLPVLTFISGFTAAPAGQVNGPYFAGTLNALKVFVSPALESGKFLIGVNGNDGMSSVAVYAPYLPICPTQLLGFADGAMSQGFSTLYDIKILNENLIIAGKVTD